tara:strand:- start:2886 stop:3092 length:207 start_codon:yes stop_codon:yes gene_type:complete
MDKIYYSEEFKCYILQKEHIKDTRYNGIVILNTKNLNKKQIINKLIDAINANSEHSEHYKNILDNLVK